MTYVSKVWLCVINNIGDVSPLTCYAVPDPSMTRTGILA